MHVLSGYITLERNIHISGANLPEIPKHLVPPYHRLIIDGKGLLITLQLLRDDIEGCFGESEVGLGGLDTVAQVPFGVLLELLSLSQVNLELLSLFIQYTIFI